MTMKAEPSATCAAADAMSTPRPAPTTGNRAADRSRASPTHAAARAPTRGRALRGHVLGINARLETAHEKPRTTYDEAQDTTGGWCGDGRMKEVRDDSIRTGSNTAAAKEVVTCPAR